MHRLILAALLLASAPVPAVAQDEPAYRAPQPPRSARVAVYRGSERQNASPVAIYRGSAAPRASSAATRAAPRARVVPVGGKQLWLVDREEDRVIACRLARSIQVGRRVIRCTEGQLALD